MRGLEATNDSPTALGGTTTLTATISQGTAPVTYTWDLGDGETANGAVVTHAYANAGNYTAVVTATNSVSTLTDTTSVVIVEQYRVFLPLCLRLK